MVRHAYGLVLIKLLNQEDPAEVVDLVPSQEAGFLALDVVGSQHLAVVGEGRTLWTLAHAGGEQAEQ